MSRNGANVYSKPAGTTAVSGSTIESAKFNELMDDIATDLNTVRPVVAGGTGGSTPATARAALGVDIGVNVQGYDAGLASIAGLTVAADQALYATGADTYATYALGALSRTFLANTTAAGYRGTLGLGDNSVLNFSDLTNTTAEWQAGTATDYGYITPAQLKAAIGSLGLLTVIEDQKASGTACASMTGGAWNTRELNTLTRNSNTAVALAANEFTMARDGWCEWMCKHTDTFNSRLYNVTDSVVVAGGSGANNGSLYNGVTEGGALVASGKTYRIELNPSVTRALAATSRGVNEVYTRVKIFAA